MGRKIIQYVKQPITNRVINPMNRYSASLQAINQVINGLLLAKCYNFCNEIKMLINFKLKESKDE